MLKSKFPFPLTKMGTYPSCFSGMFSSYVSTWCPKTPVLNFRQETSDDKQKKDVPFM